MNHPSKKVFILAALCLLILAGVVYIKRSDFSMVAYFEKNSQPLAVTATNSPSIELKSREFYEQASSNTPSTSMTEKIARDLFLNYADLKNKGAWNADEEANLVDSLTVKYASSTKPRVAINDIIAFSDRDTAKIRIFGNTVARTLKIYNPSLKTSPIDIINDAMNNTISTGTAVSKLSVISSAYERLAKDLAKIPAPANLIPAYTDIINTYFFLSVNTVDMSVFSTDSARAFLGANSYITNLTNQMYLLKNTADYFRSNGILFSDTEEGSVWNSLMN